LEIDLKVNSVYGLVVHLECRRANYYSVKYEDDEKSITERFFEWANNEPDLVRDVENLEDWIEQVGRIGPRRSHFKHESAAFAPRTPFFVSENEKGIRLYCHWDFKGVIVLFSGQIKTTDKAQDCPNVRSHFMKAQQYVKDLADEIETDGFKTITNLEEILIL